MRKSKREIDRDLEQLGECDKFSLHDFLFADLKAAHDGPLSAGERRLLDAPEKHLPPAARRRLDIGSEMS